MNLKNLEVKSFLTNMTEETAQTVKGGNFSVIAFPELSNIITQCAFECINNDCWRQK